jgi:hypothetical protein
MRAYMQHIDNIPGFSRSQGIQILGRLPRVARDTDLIPVAYPAHPRPATSFYRIEPRGTKPRVRQKDRLTSCRYPPRQASPKALLNSSAPPSMLRMDLFDQRHASTFHRDACS